ncbi:MAG: hypothetical protein ACOCUP_00925 [bacterium]
MYPGTELMSEGYANWLDGSYASYDIRDIIVSYRNKEPEKIMTPDELLNDTDRNENVYYPNLSLYECRCICQNIRYILPLNNIAENLSHLMVQYILKIFVN